MITAELTPRNTIRVTLTDWADQDIIKRIPGRAYLGKGRGSNPAWEIPGTHEAALMLRELLPLVEISPQVNAYLESRAGWLRRLDDAHAGKYNRDWPLSFVTAKPYQHQQVGRAVTEAVSQGAPATGLWHSPGLGKSLTTLAMIAGKRPRVVLVVCPASVIGVWKSEVEKFANFPIRVWPLIGLTVKRAAKVMTLPIDEYEGTTMLVTNYESIWRPAFLKALIGANVDIMVCDEAHKLKSAGSAQSKAARKIGAGALRVALTGTPTDTPQDWYGIYRWMDASVFGTSYTAFVARYFDTYQIPGVPQPMVGRVKPEMEAELHARAHSLAHACSKEDALDLPPRVALDRFTELEPKALKLYNEMKNEAIAYLDSGDPTVGQNVLTRMMRMSQIEGGFVNDADGKSHAVSTALLNLLKEELQTALVTEEKVVIFARYTAEIDAILRLCRGREFNQDGRPMGVGLIDGRVKIGDERDEVIRSFQEDDVTRVVVVQYKAGGAGITLHRSAYCFYYGFPDSSIDWLQAMDRVHRIGQARSVTDVNLMVRGGIREAMLKRLREKRDVAHRGLHGYRQLLS